MEEICYFASYMEINSDNFAVFSDSSDALFLPVFEELSLSNYIELTE
jgi:hypothetical protein